MRLEIIVNNEDPLIYPLNREKIVIGSGDTCDIIIKNKNVSRKHLVIINKNETFFVVDQGSTNGSFLNEERLVPGSSVEFTSFFPVRLGDNILLTLLSDEDAQSYGEEQSLTEKISEPEPAREESTKMISLKDLKKSSTAGLVKKRAKTIEKKKAPAKKKAKKNFNLMGFFCLVIVGGAAYYNLVIARKAKEEAAAAAELLAQQASNEVVLISKKKLATGPIVRPEETLLAEIPKVMTLWKQPKCSQEKEKYLCVALPMVFQGQWGVIQSEKIMNLLGDGAKYLADAKNYIKTPATEAEMPTYQMDLQLMSLMLWIYENVPADLMDLDQVKDYTFVIALIDPTIPEGELKSSALINPDGLIRLRAQMQPKHFEEAKTVGAASFSYALDYLRLP